MITYYRPEQVRDRDDYNNQSCFVIVFINFTTVGRSVDVGIYEV